MTRGRFEQVNTTSTSCGCSQVRTCSGYDSAWTSLLLQADSSCSSPMLDLVVSIVRRVDNAVSHRPGVHGECIILRSDRQGRGSSCSGRLREFHDRVLERLRLRITSVRA